MGIDETVCDDGFQMEQPTEAPGASSADAAAAGSGEPASSVLSALSKAGSRRSDKHLSENFDALSAAAAAPEATEQPIGAQAATTAAASSPHLATIVGRVALNEPTGAKFHDSDTTDAFSNSNNSQPPNASPRKASSSSRLANSRSGSIRGGLSSKRQQQVLQSSQSQTRINHSLESIESRYSTSSGGANDDSTTASMQQLSQSPQLQVQPHQRDTKLQQPRHSLRHRLSTSPSSNCSPIEAQLASSTCDLGINLLDGGGWRGSFSSTIGGGGGSTPAREPAKSLVAFISLAADKANPPSDSSNNNNGASAEKQLQEQAQNVADEPKPPFMFAGVLASIVGSVFFSLSVLCIKLLPNQEGFSEKVKALCFRGVFVSILCGVAILVQRSTFIVRRDELFVNILRAVFGTFGVLGLYSALSYISMGDATALIFSSPVWTSILSYFILKEPLQWLQLIALPASLFGIVLIAHPALIVDVEHHNANPHPAVAANDSVSHLVLSIASPTIDSLHHQNGSSLNQSSLDLAPALAANAPSPSDFEHRWPGILIALATSLLVSCVYIALKFRKTTPIQTTTFWFGMFMVSGSLAIQCFTGPIDIPLTVYEWALLFGNGVTSWLGQSFLQWAFLYEEAGVLSIVRTLDVAMTFILSALFLDEEILWTSIVGATIIGLVVASIMLNEWIKKLSCSQRKNSTLEDDESAHGTRFALDSKDQLGLSKSHQHSVALKA